MAETEKDIRAALAMYHAADSHQKANLAIERWLFATTPKKLEALFAELDQLRQAQVQLVIAPWVMLTDGEIDAVVDSVSDYPGSFCDNIAHAIQAAFIAKQTSAAHGITQKET